MKNNKIISRFNKCKKVIKSCETFEQYLSAVEYVELFKKQYVDDVLLDGLLSLLNVELDNVKNKIENK